MSNFSLSKYSEYEKNACLPVIDLLLNCAVIARRDGVLALEKFVREQDDEFLAFAMMMVIDGTDPEIVKGILETLTAADNHMRTELLKRVLVTEGALSIQAGEHPHLIETKLLAFLGEKFLRKRGHFPFYSRPDEEDKRREFVPKNNVDEAFDNAILRLPDSAIQELFKDVDQNELAAVISGCAKNVAEKLLRNVSPRLSAVILDNIEKIDARDIAEAREKFTEIISRYR